MIEISNIYLVFVLQCLELISSLLIMWKVFQCRLKRKKIVYVIGLILFGVNLIVLNFNIEYVYPVWFILEVVIVFLLFDEKVNKKILLYLTSYIISYILSTLIIIVLSILLNTKETYFITNHNWRIIIIFINIFIVLLFAIWINIKGLESRIRNIKLKYFIVGLPGLFCCVLVLVFLQIGRTNSINDTWNKAAVLSTTIICIFFIFGSAVFILINDSRKYFQLQNEMNEKFMNIQYDYFRKIIENDQDIRKFKHEIKSQMGCIRVLVEEEKYKEISSYIAEMNNEVDNLLQNKIKSGNDIVDAVINYLLMKDKQEDIDIQLNGRLPKELKVSAYDLCVIFANTLSNALEACKLLEQKKFINIFIDLSEQYLFISVENSVNKTVDLDILGNGTIKEDKMNHGFGIRNLINSANKYNGDVKFKNELGKFRVEIILLNVI